MIRPTGLLGKITRAFMLQAGMITLAAILGVYLAKIVIEETLVKNAILEEAEYFWKYYLDDRGFSLPDTKNMTGYFDPDLLPPVIRDDLPSKPGFYEYSDLSNRLVLYIDRRAGETLYLVYYRGQVDALVLYYGLFPLLIVLTLLYLTLWIAYRFSRRTISPITRLANHINGIDLGKEGLSLRLAEPGLQSDDEIQILADALADLGERVDAFIARERNFTRNASHELRTPLTVINTAADMLLIDKQLPVKSREILHKVKRAVEDMENLTEVFLMLAREDAGLLTRRPVEVNRVVREQIERAEFIDGSDRLHINLDARARVEVLSSETVLSVLIGNLIRNAVLYTRKGEVDIEIDSDGLTISDRGPGIPEHSIEQLFEPFHRAGSENASGHGIGLTIVKRLCDRFGWRIEVARRAQRGTSFRLCFAPTSPA
ncbi:MAG: HAMP domain-containing sensor histidine kinase [Gammaproteobacteria bacterium]|jgi:signal transduction histidine kinase